MADETDEAVVLTDSIRGVVVDEFMPISGGLVEEFIKDGIEEPLLAEEPPIGEEPPSIKEMERNAAIKVRRMSYELNRIMPYVDNAEEIWNGERERSKKVCDIIGLAKGIDVSLPDNYKSRLGSSYSITSQIIQFYILSFLDFKYPHTQEVVVRKRRLAKVLASKIGYYCLYSCFGEARHGRGRFSSEDFSSDIAVGLISSGTVSRHTAWDACVLLLRFVSPVEILDSLVEIFSMSGWGKGYGGTKWKSIAALTRKWFSGEFSDVVYIDTVVNAVHNGGWAFDKYYAKSACCNHHHTQLQEFVNYKASNIEGILKYVCMPKLQIVDRYRKDASVLADTIYSKIAEWREGKL